MLVFQILLYSALSSNWSGLGVLVNASPNSNWQEFLTGMCMDWIVIVICPCLIIVFVVGGVVGVVVIVFHSWHPHVYFCIPVTEKTTGAENRNGWRWARHRWKVYNLPVNAWGWRGCEVVCNFKCFINQLCYIFCLHFDVYFFPH